MNWNMASLKYICFAGFVFKIAWNDAGVLPAPGNQCDMGTGIVQSSA
jgi:hypothetical protein